MTGCYFLAAMRWTREFSFGIVPMGLKEMFLLIFRFIVGSVVQAPEPTTIAKWGGFAKDIKGRDTPRYQFATAGNK